MPPVEPYYRDDQVTLHLGDSLEVLRTLPDESVNCVVTSPPYFGLRDYGVPGQYGIEETSAAYVETMRAVFLEVRRVLAEDGTLWLNLGDTYSSKANAGSSVSRTRRRDRAEAQPVRHNTTADAPYKSLLMIPERVVLELIGAGWILRNKVVWPKTNPLPESVTDRLSSSWEPIYMLSRSAKYWFDVDAVKQPATGLTPGNKAFDYGARGGMGIQAAHRFGGNAGSTLSEPRTERRLTDVWSMATASFPDAHFAVFPKELVRRCVLAGCKPGGVVLDPFSGSGTTGAVALRSGRRYVGIDLSEEYLELSLRTRLAQSALIDDECDGAA